MKTDDKIAAIIQNNVFLQMLAQLQNGRVVTELTEKMPQLIAAVKATGKKGKLILELSVQPDGKGEVETVEIRGTPTLKLPDRDRKATTFFIVGECDLSRVGANQPEFEFSEQQKEKERAAAAPKATAAK